MTDLPFRKLYVDTRFKTFDSISNTDIKFQLRRPASMPVNTTFYVDEINIPYSWNTIEAGINDRLYVSSQQASNPLVYTILTIPPRRYSGTELATQLQTLLTAAALGTWAVGYDTTMNTLTFSANLTAFKIFTDGDLAIDTFFIGIDHTSPQSVNDILQIYGVSKNYVNSGIRPFTTGFLNLLNYQDLYLTSGNLGNFDSQGARGESSIIRKICVNAAWGFSIIDKQSGDTDHMGCSKVALSTVDFQLRDVQGRIVPLHGAHISFTIKFLEN